MEDFKEEKLASLRQKVREGSKDPEHHRDLADLLCERGEWREACALLDSARRLPLTDAQQAELSIQYGLLLYEYLGDDDKALESARTALDLLGTGPAEGETLLLRGLAQSLLAHCLWLREPETAVGAARRSLGDLESVLLTNPNDLLAKTALQTTGALYLLLDDFENAIKACNAWMRLVLKQDESLRCMITLGRALHGKGDADQAVRVLRKAVDCLEENVELTFSVHYELGVVELSKKEFRNAKDSFLIAAAALQKIGAASSPGIKFANIGLVEANYELGQFQDAIDAAKEIIAFRETADPGHWTAVAWLGYCYLALGGHSQARSHFEEVRNSSQASSEIRDWVIDGLKEVLDKLGGSNYASGDFAKAASEYERLLVLYASDDGAECTIHLNLAHCRAALGEPEQARKHYQAILASGAATIEQKAEACEALRMGGSASSSPGRIQ